MNAPVAGALRENLLDWEDQDVTAYKLGISLGLFEPDDGSYAQFRERKGILHTANPVSDFLYGTLKRLVDLGLLELDADEQKYRWKAGAETKLLA